MRRCPGYRSTYLNLNNYNKYKYNAATPGVTFKYRIVMKLSLYT